MAIPNGDDLMMSVAFNKKLAQQTQDNIDSLYKSTYYTDNKDKAYIDNTRERMNRVINGLVDKTKLRTGETNISALYARTFAKGEHTLTTMKELTDSSMLSDIMDLYGNNIFIRDLDKEIDVILKYVPRLEKAIKLIKDSVLAADHMTEEDTDISVISSSSNDSRENNEGTGDADRILSCKRKYNWSKLKDDIYLDTAKYGEQFVYIVPYRKAMNRLLAKANSVGMTESVFNTEEGHGLSYLTEDAIEQAIHEASIPMEFGYITESGNAQNSNFGISSGNLYELSTLTPQVQGQLESNESYSSIKVEINTSGVIPSILTEQSRIIRILEETASLNEAGTPKLNYGLVRNSDYMKNIDKDFKKFVKGSLEGPTGDGFTSTSRGSRNSQVNIPGCVVEILERAYTRPISIKGTCLGYYYIECDQPLPSDAQTTFTSTLGGIRPRRSAQERENMDRTGTDNEEVLKKIAQQISEKIDAKFINANQDLAHEIYTILKYNADHGDGKIQKIRVSFIPPDDVVHCYFNKNRKTGRGISDLEKSLFPAKLFSCMYISNVIAILTRGYDKRVYHVRQSVDTNITAVLMNVINQIKQSNFNLRQIENMNNILNITGRFNDLVIPQNANGESPVNMEVLPGQNIEVRTEFMNSLEEMAIEQLGVSIEMITNHYQSEQSATNAVQNSQRFLLMIQKRQAEYAPILSTIFTKIYQAENDCEDIVEVKLPVPSMLRLSNTSQMIQTANDIIQNVTQMMYGSDPREEAKLEFTSQLMKFYLGDILPMEEINKLRDKTEVNLAVAKDSSPSMDDMSGGGNMGGM